MLKDFINQFNNKSLDYDGVYGGQCVDLAKKWLSVLGYSVTGAWGNAIDWDKHGSMTDLEWIANTPTGVPQEGDLIVWGMKPYGHIAVFIEGNTNRFTSFDQNYPVGSVCHVQEHNYSNVKGWLRPLKYKKEQMIPHSSIEGRVYNADGKLIYWIDSPETINKYFEGGTGEVKPITDLIAPTIKEIIKEVEKIVEVKIPVEIVKEIIKQVELTDEQKQVLTAWERIKEILNKVREFFTGKE